MTVDSNSKGSRRIFRAVIGASCLISAIILIAEQNWKVVIPFMILALVVFLLAESYLRE